MWKSAKEYQQKMQGGHKSSNMKPDMEQRSHTFKVARETLGLKENDEMEEVEVDKDERIGRL